MLMCAYQASAQVTISYSNQTGSANVWPFTPTYVVDQAHSLINNLTPATASGNYNLESQGGNRNVNSLTFNTNLTLNKANSTTSTNYVTYGNGSGSGSLLIYNLPSNTFGYNLTNITTYGGWADNGRDQQAFLVYYSTVQSPGNFIYLATVNDNPSIGGNTADCIQTIINNPSGNNLIASNVAALEFVFSIPGVENGYCGIAAITVGGTAAASQGAAELAVSAASQSGSNPFTPTWLAETTNDLILGLSPSSSSASVNFTLESAGGIPILTDGTVGTSGNNSTLATCGANGGTSLIYTLTNSPTYGSDITNIITYSGWGDYGRDGQYYTVSYSTISQPSTYIPITTVYYLPSGSGTPANRVSISMNDGSAIAHGVATIQFNFNPSGAGNFNNAYQGYSELIVQGQNSTAPPPPPSAYLIQDSWPTRAETFAGDQVVFTAAYSNGPPPALQWQQITTSPAATNNINTGVTYATNNGIVTSTLTLNNVQSADVGSYRLQGLNATNGAAAASYSTAAPLTVFAATTVGNVIQENSGQTGPGALVFYPAWSINTNADLIYQSATYTDGTGNFSLESGLNTGDPGIILADGNINSDKGNMVGCGWVNNNPAAGQSVTYTLPSTSFGYNLTNIAVYGGWGDDGRNEQKYQVLYSTVSNPSTFVSIGTFDYNPSFSDGEPNSTRTILIPVSVSLAQNVAAVQINFNFQPKNGWEGYSEITIGGTPSLGTIPPLTNDIAAATAEDVAGSKLTLSAGFGGVVTGYQWLKNGTNLVGQTSPILTLNDLQISDTATNGGYRLLAYNAAGTNTSRSCTVMIDSAPLATNNVITAFAYQTSDTGAGFSPTWDTNALANSLIYGQNPPSVDYDQTGDFYDPDGNISSHNLAGGLPVLTDGNYGMFTIDGSHPAFATGGNSTSSNPQNAPGDYVIYSLGANANGYTITNIQIAGGWNDNGRDSQYYTVLYSTVNNPNAFIPLTAVANNLSAYGVNDYTAVRTTMSAANGVLASNVYAIEVDFQFPDGVPNGYSGYSEISVFGSPSASAPPVSPVITVQHEENTFDYTLETPNLISQQFPSSYAPSALASPNGEGCTTAGFTDGILSFGGNANSGMGGTDTNNSYQYIVYTSAANSSWNITNIITYSLWHDYGRDGQFYTVSYSKPTAPNTFLPLASVGYDPFVPHDGRSSANRVQISPLAGQTLLASNVAAVKFDFASQGSEDYNWSGYTEIVLQGAINTGVTSTLPTVFSGPRISGSNLILTGSGGTPAGYHYTWLSTTNLAAPIVWTTNMSGNLDGTGSFSNSIPVGTGPQTFFRFRMP